MDFDRLPICVLAFDRPDDLRAMLASLRAAMAQAGMCGPVVLFQDGAPNPAEATATRRAVAACRQVFQDAVPHGVVFDAPGNLGIAANTRRAEAWAFEAMRYPAALFFADDLVLAPPYFRAMAALHRVAVRQPRVAMFSAVGADPAASLAGQFERRAEIGPMDHGRGYGLMRDAWQKSQPLLAEYDALLTDRQDREPPLDRVALWYGRMGWPPLLGSQWLARAVALNTLGLACITSVANCARKTGTPHDFAAAALLAEAQPDPGWHFADLSDAAVTEIVAGQRAWLLRMRLGPEAFVGCAGLTDTLRLLRHIGGETLLGNGAGLLMTGVSGLYPDRWCHPATTFTFAAGAALRELTIAAVAAQHLPRGTNLEFRLNGQLAGAVWLDPGETFSLTLPLPARLDGLEKILAAQCGVTIDPCSVGFNADRRPLSFLLESLTLIEAGGGRTVLTGEAMAGRSAITPSLPVA